MKGTICTLKPSNYRWFYIIASLLWVGSIFGQEFTVSGRVFDEAGKKMGPARIVLYDLDKKKVAEFETPGSGKFKFKKIPNGSYTMNIYGENGYGGMEKVSISGANISDINPSLNPNPDQVQVSVKPTEKGSELNWRKTPGSVEFVIYRDNNEVKRVTETVYLDLVEPGKTFAYNVVAVNSDQSTGTRSITEYGKSLMPAPVNTTSDVNKNIVKINWDAVENATAYRVFRDSELVNTTSENSYSDFKLKYSTEYGYAIAALDHQGDEGSKSANFFGTTHPEIAKTKGLKAESGANEVALIWKTAQNSIKYYIYQNGTLVDSTTGLSKSITTEAGTENCFTIAGVDKYGSIGTKSDAACDKSVFSAPDTIQVTNDKRNNNLIEWSAVEGASSYNLYANGKMQTNTTKLEINLKGLKWDTDYSYYLTSLTDDGVEGPQSNDYTVRTPNIFTIDGLLLDETGDEKNVDLAKVFLYDSSGVTLLEDFVVSKNGKFRFEKEIIAGNYTIMVYGNGSGNGGDRVQISNSNITDLKINLSTEGLRSKIWVERGVEELTVHWTDIPQAKSYNIYKNGRVIQNIIGDTSYTDPVAPGIPTTLMVRSIDLYDLEGPESNIVTETSSYKPPELFITVVAGGYAVEGSGRLVNLSWQPVPGVEQYALYRDGELLSKQSEPLYEEKDLEWYTKYVYDINCIDGDGIEGVNYTDSTQTHPEVTAPVFKLKGEVNSIALSWDRIEGMVGKYKIFRNGGNIADVDAFDFIDNVTPGIEYCYTVAAEDTHKTVGPDAKIQCGKGYFAPPGNFTGKVLKNSISFNWESVLAASGYRLYRDDELIFDTPDLTVYVDENLDFDKNYNYEACSYDQDGDEGPKISFPFTTHEEVLATSITAEADLEKITLNWDRSSLRVDHNYKIYRDNEFIFSTKDTTYDDIMPAGQFYCYKITVIDKYDTEGPSSNEECKKILVNYPKMLTVTGDVRRVLFNWKYMVGGVSYNIYLAEKESDSLSFLTKTKSNYYEHKGLEFDTEYCYQVSSIDQDDDEGPRSPTMCGYVLPPPHLTLIEKRFVEASGNGILDGREHGWAMFKIVNDGRSPAREIKPWLKPLEEGAVTPSLKIDSVSMTPVLNVGDTLSIQFPIYAKLKIESGDRNFNLHVEEFTGMDLEPEPLSFQTLKVIPPDLVVTDFAINNEWGQHYIPLNETVTMSIRVQNLSVGKSDTVSVKFRRDSSFVSEDADELHQFRFVNSGEHIDFSFEIMSREERFTVSLELYDYFETRKTVQLHLETMKKYKSVEDMVIYESPFPENVVVGEAVLKPELTTGIPKASMERETIGIVLGNPNFWDESIIGKESTNENVHQVRDYFKDLFGMEDHSIIPSQFWFFNDGISSRDFKAIFDPDLGYIRKKIESNLSYAGQKSMDLMLYYSGEGTTFKGDKALIPFDADITKDNTFFTLNELYSDLEKLQGLEHVGNITLFMDVDFNNAAFDQNIVKKSDIVEDSKKKKKKKKKRGEPEEPVVLLPKEIMPPTSITAFYASNITQLAYDHPDLNNSLFTYYLLKGLKGEADNGDKEVTVAELHDYVLRNVQDTTKELYQDLPQIPQLFSSDPDRVLYKLP